MIETLFILAALGIGAAGLRYLWRKAAGHATEVERLQAQVAIECARAQRQAVPHHVNLNMGTYAPHFRQTAPTVAATPPPGELADAAPVVPSFADLLGQGQVQHTRDDVPLLLGFDRGSGAALAGQWLDVYSSALAGMPHSGKTTSQRFLACQLALRGAKFVICDPHRQAGDDSLAATLEPLRQVFLCEPADDPATILDSIRYIDAIGRARTSGQPYTDRVILWIDELNGLLTDGTIGPELLRLLKETSRQYRKVDVFICAVAHTWSASSTGGSSDLRANFASRMCHRMERQQARLLLPTDLAARAERLEPGQAVLHSMRHSTVVQVPKTTAADVVTVAGLLTADHPTVEAPRKPHGSPAETSHTAQERQILDMLRAGVELPQIARTISGAKAGRKYDAALRQIEETLRVALGRDTAA